MQPLAFWLGAVFFNQGSARIKTMFNLKNID